MQFRQIIILPILAFVLTGCQQTQPQGLSEAERHSRQQDIRQERDQQIKDAENLALAEKRICINQRHAGTIQTLAESVKCSNPRIIAAYERVKFPYMDLVKQYADKRLELIERLEKKEISEAQFNKEINECLPYLTAEAHIRDLEKQS